ncbi:MAG TPA: hypothetical protein VHV10_02280 [Ktedonobacteraceae bacterium]|jgi:hypothetical protein|nr:hypothetical protein [Ktedonobacteraceae bacterium]
MSDPSIQRGPSKEVPCIGYDATTKHAYVPLEAVSVQQDATTGQWYGVLNVNTSFSASPINSGIPTEVTVSVGVTSGTALAANANAKMRQFQNVSPNGIYLSFSGAAAVVGQGTYLSPMGGSVLYDRYIPNGIVKAIATGASSNLLVTEG